MDAQVKINPTRDIPEILTTATLHAPRAVVYRTMLDPELIPQWWGPAKYQTKVDIMEARKGGIWRYTQFDETTNTEFAFTGIYHSLSIDAQISTFEWEGLPGHVLLTTLTLEDDGETTRLTEQSVFQSLRDRDGMLANGMENGAIELYDRLNILVNKEKTSE